MSNQPVWLLDFDGVLNGSRVGWSAAPITRWVQGWKIRWSSDAVARLNAIDASGRVNIRWATSWVPHAG